MADREPTYQEQIAVWRQQRSQEQVAARVEEIKAEYTEAVTERDRHVAEGDLETAGYYDDTVQRLDCEYQQYVPPPRPQAHPRVLGLAQRNMPFFRKFGPNGFAMADKAHNYVVNNMRISPDNPKYGDAVLSYMELYAKDHGMPYDRKDQELTPNQAAKISGLSPQQYNNAARQLAAQGRFRRK
jgi:hypothetical protein